MSEKLIDTNKSKVLILDCDECVLLGEDRNLLVVCVDDEKIHILCDNHDPPRQVYSVTVPEEERVEMNCSLCKAGVPHGSSCGKPH